MSLLWSNSSCCEQSNGSSLSPWNFSSVGLFYRYSPSNFSLSTDFSPVRRLTCVKVTSGPIYLSCRDDCDSQKLGGSVEFCSPDSESLCNWMIRFASRAILSASAIEAESCPQNRIQCKTKFYKIYRSKHLLPALRAVW